MKAKPPVSNIEYSLINDKLILSTTDAKKAITYVNQQSIEVSGVTNDELLGKAHNIEHRPERRPETFTYLWKTLKDRKSWTDLIKNRRNNGDIVLTDFMRKIQTLLRMTIGKHIAKALFLPMLLLFSVALAGWWNCIPSIVAPWLNNFISVATIGAGLVISFRIYSITQACTETFAGSH
ncbi:PAS domain S-box protein [Nitrosomonas aestuarii]|uniref:PAS domain S-box protein n=1 Tax=Nitrosomonas aestuarii TaxID=52441 RepID=UPI000D2F5C61|nr:PAS domain S-box protein [Nitrosomonas aestuarii]PTN11404.1 PAS domain S-box-containing protein [Nitrosomonas aestuarii]